MISYEDYIFTNEIITSELLELLKQNDCTLIKFKNVYNKENKSYYRIKKIHEDPTELNNQLNKLLRSQNKIKYTFSYKKEFWLHKDIKNSYFDVLLTTIINEKPVLIILENKISNETEIKTEELIERNINKICEIFNTSTIPDETKLIAF